MVNLTKSSAPSGPSITKHQGASRFLATQFKNIGVVGSVVLLMGAEVLAQQYDFQHYQIRDGLPSAQVQGLGLDSEGKMWASTRAGLAWFDGRV